MPLVIPELPTDAHVRLNRLVLALGRDASLLDDCLKGEVRVERSASGDVLLFTNKAAGRGFYFERCDPSAALEAAIAIAIQTPRQYHCSTFVIDESDPTVVDKLLTRFVEQHGAKLAAKIDHFVTTHEGKKVVHVKFPACVLRHMMAPTGGLMKTGFSGPLSALAELPTLVRLGVLSSAVEVDGRVKSVVATEYPEEYYHAVQRLHWDLVREVVAKKGGGICLGPVAVWDA